VIFASVTIDDPEQSVIFVPVPSVVLVLEMSGAIDASPALTGTVPVTCDPATGPVTPPTLMPGNVPFWSAVESALAVPLNAA
jgi:hypothetical protein